MALKQKPVEESNIKKSKRGITKIDGQQPIFPIVGIGASAGGLEALEMFLSNVPVDNGMAFVIIQHLDPTRKGMLAELLQRSTLMRVFQARDRMMVEVNCVYVIPPNKDLSILHGALYLLEPVAPRGLRLPIDFFFRALADDRQEQSIGVILSGMGSDGTLGVRAIKEKAGGVFVQEPSSAQFDSMPDSVIEGGLADVIATPDVLPGKISAYLRQIPLGTLPGRANHHVAHSSLEKIMIILRNHSGHDFSLYKTATVYRRIERRMALQQIERIADYVKFLQENVQERELLFNELLIGVTNFFRDPQAWKQLESEVLPAMLSGRTPKSIMRVWVPACSTGEEAYSWAILLKEALEKLKLTSKISVQIFATDLDRHAIEKAREGIFPNNIVADVSSSRLERFFFKMDESYQVAKPIRDMIIFATQDIIIDPPFTRLDILSCRNLLIYMSPELQKKLVPVFYYCLKPKGVLLLGSAETVGNFTDLFEPLPGKNHLFERQDSAPNVGVIEFPSNFIAAKREPPKPAIPAASLQVLADSLLLQTYAPAAVLTNAKGDIVYINGRTGKYMEPASGKANWNIFVMAREDIRYQLTSAFRKALVKKETITLEKVALHVNGQKEFVNLTIQPIEGSHALAGMVMIVFNDVVVIPPETETTAKPRPGVRRKGSAQEKENEFLQQELERVRREAQSVHADMQTSQEELKSANEELQSTNEEIQSANEELTTSKEEMQSMNEELMMVNQELQIKVGELSRTSNDMKNLLDSTDIAILFLDNDLTVRRFTSQTGKLTQLIPTDVGRPITDIASALLYPELATDAREVLRTLTRVERHLPFPGGDWYAARILPYFTLENTIEGVVITFTDITSSKKMELELSAMKKGSGEKPGEEQAKGL